jgi:biopolymer transport protein TolR
MAMRLGRGGGPTSEINVTPMIDVLLVLLIIFMVVQREMQRGVPVQVPAPDVVRSPDDPDRVVLQVGSDGAYLLNRTPVAPGELEATLRRVYDARARKVLFVDGSASASYSHVIRAVDASRRAGIEIVGLVPQDRA